MFAQRLGLLIDYPRILLIALTVALAGCSSGGGSSSAVPDSNSSSSTGSTSTSSSGGASSGSISSTSSSSSSTSSSTGSSSWTSSSGSPIPSSSSTSSSTSASTTWNGSSGVILGAHQADWLFASYDRLTGGSGTTVRMTGVNWTDFETTRTLADLSGRSLRTHVQELATRGINVLRIPLTVELIRNWMNGDESREVFTGLVDACQELGVKIILAIEGVEQGSE